MFLLYHSEGCNTSETVFHWCYVNDLHTTHAVVCWVTALTKFPSSPRSPEARCALAVVRRSSEVCHRPPPSRPRRRLLTGDLTLGEILFLFFWPSDPDPVTLTDHLSEQVSDDLVRPNHIRSNAPRQWSERTGTLQRDCATCQAQVCPKSN
jgi:hypothetical protein